MTHPAVQYHLDAAAAADTAGGSVEQITDAIVDVLSDSALAASMGNAGRAWVGKSWQFEGIRFAMAEHSKRPAMAFVSFTREAPAVTADTEAPAS